MRHFPSLVCAISLAASAASAGEAAPPPATPEAVKPAAESTKPALLLPPKPPVRAKTSLDSAGDVARDLAAAVEYFEAGQAYFRAFTKGSHTAEENQAFVRFLEDYEKELVIARKTHSLVGLWLEKKSGIKD